MIAAALSKTETLDFSAPAHELAELIWREDPSSDNFLGRGVVAVHLQGDLYAARLPVVPVGVAASKVKTVTARKLENSVEILCHGAHTTLAMRDFQAEKAAKKMLTPLSKPERGKRQTANLFPVN